MPNFRLIDAPTEVFYAKALATIAVGDALKFGSGGVDVAGDGNTVDAFALSGGSSGTYVKCGRGVMQVVGLADTGVNFAAGDQVYLAAGQKLDAGSATNKSLGTCIPGEDPATAGLVVFTFDPYASFTHA